MVHHQSPFPTPFYPTGGSTSPIYETPPSILSQNVRNGYDKNFFDFSQQQQQQQQHQQMHQQQQREQQIQQQQQNFFQNQNVQFSQILPGNMGNPVSPFTFNTIAGLGNMDTKCGGGKLPNDAYGKKPDINLPLNQFNMTNQPYQQMNQEALKFLSPSQESVDNSIQQHKFYDNELLQQQKLQARHSINSDVAVSPTPSTSGSTTNPKLNRSKQTSKTKQISEERYKKSSINTVFSSLNQKSSSAAATPAPTASNTSSDTKDKSKTSESKLKETRYDNTVSALKKAGLMDITLQTGELLKKSNSLQKDIDMLEEIVKVTKHLMNNE